MSKFNMRKLVHGKENHIPKAEFYDFRNLGVLKYIFFLRKMCFKLINWITFRPISSLFLLKK